VNEGAGADQHSKKEEKGVEKIAQDTEARKKTR